MLPVVDVGDQQDASVILKDKPITVTMSDLIFKGLESNTLVLSASSTSFYQPVSVFLMTLKVLSCLSLADSSVFFDLLCKLLLFSVRTL